MTNTNEQQTKLAEQLAKMTVKEIRAQYKAPHSVAGIRLNKSALIQWILTTYEHRTEPAEEYLHENGNPEESIALVYVVTAETNSEHEPDNVPRQVYYGEFRRFHTNQAESRDICTTLNSSGEWSGSRPVYRVETTFSDWLDDAEKAEALQDYPQDCTLAEKLYRRGYRYRLNFAGGNIPHLHFRTISDIARAMREQYPNESGWSVDKLTEDGKQATPAESWAVCTIQQTLNTPPEPETTANESGYNGWSNYETWNVPLWIDNDQSTYSRKLELLQHLPTVTADDAEIISLEFFPDQLTPDFENSEQWQLIDWQEIAEHWETERAELCGA